ncbi:MAG TPA: hypothetical protein VL400_22755 [Polyangiaceae bacterium]|jgi:hypothetical protein|nr:hypothetical protein [Polyangiaceae bacterium]
MHPVALWLFEVMALVAPPDRAANEKAFPGYQETIEERRERYAAIAEAARDVAYDPNEKPVFGGKYGRARTAALMLAVAYHESGFMKDVDLGPCWRGKAGTSTRCDSGRAACLMQIHVADGQTAEGYTREELFADRKKCFRSGLHLLRRSMSACSHLPEKHKLASYASGTCKGGLKDSESLMALYEKFASLKPMPKADPPKGDAPKNDPPK